MLCYVHQLTPLETALLAVAKYNAMKVSRKETDEMEKLWAETHDEPPREAACSRDNSHVVTWDI